MQRGKEAPVSEPLQSGIRRWLFGVSTPLVFGQDHVKAFASDDQTAALLEELEGVAEDKGQEKQYAADCRQRLEVLQVSGVMPCVCSFTALC